MKKISLSDKQFHQPLSIANTLNSYFYEIVSELASALPLHEPIEIARQDLDFAFSVKYHGFAISCHLSVHQHIEYNCKKISKNIDVMTIGKKNMYQIKQSFISMDYSLIYSY